MVGHNDKLWHRDICNKYVCIAPSLLVKYMYTLPTTKYRTAGVTGIERHARQEHVHETWRYLLHIQVGGNLPALWKFRYRNQSAPMIRYETVCPHKSYLPTCTYLTYLQYLHDLRLTDLVHPSPTTTYFTTPLSAGYSILYQAILLLEPLLPHSNHTWTLRLKYPTSVGGIDFVPTRRHTCKWADHPIL